MSLFGDKVVELFLRNHSISIGIGSVDHILKDSVISKLSQILSNFAEVFKGDIAGLLRIEGDENLMNFFSEFIV